MLSKSMLASIALGALLIPGGAGTARADDWKADHERHELDRLFARCRYH